MLYNVLGGGGIASLRSDPQVKYFVHVYFILLVMQKQFRMNYLIYSEYFSDPFLADSQIYRNNIFLMKDLLSCFKNSVIKIFYRNSHFSVFLIECNLKHLKFASSYKEKPKHANI